MPIGARETDSSPRGKSKSKLVETGILTVGTVAVNLQSETVSDMHVIEAVEIEASTIKDADKTVDLRIAPDPAVSATNAVEYSQCCNLLLIIYSEDTRSVGKGTHAAASPSDFMMNCLQRAFALSKADTNLSYHICAIELLPKTMQSPAQSAWENEMFSKRDSVPSIRSWLWPSCASARGSTYLLTKSPRRFNQIVSARSALPSECSIDVSHHWMYSKHEENAVKKRAASSSSIEDRLSKVRRKQGSDHASPQIYYHYLYSTESEVDNGRIVREKRNYLGCPWCKFNPGKCDLKRPESTANFIPIDDLDDEPTDDRAPKKNWGPLPPLPIRILINHLVNCHQHFLYEFVIDQLGNFHIVIKRDSSQDVQDFEILSEKYVPYTFFRSKNKRKDLMEFAVTNVVVGSNFLDGDREAGDDGSESEDEMDEEERLRVSKITATSRQYYHSRTGVPLNDEELEVDSDDDVDMTLELRMNNALLEDFVDVSYEEKVMTKHTLKQMRLRTKIVSLSFKNHLLILFFLPDFYITCFSKDIHGHVACSHCIFSCLR